MVQRTHGTRGSHEQGLTLVEMMVGVLLFTLLSAGAFMVVTGQQRSDQAQQRGSTALDNARLTLNTIANQLRIAKAGMPQGVGLNRAWMLPTTPQGVRPRQCPLGSGVLVPSFEVIDGGADGSDRLRIIYPDGGSWGTLVNAVAPISSQVTVRTPGNEPPVLPDTAWGMLTNYDRAILFAPGDTGACPPHQCVGKPQSWGWPGGLAGIPAGRTLLRANWVEYHIGSMKLGSGGNVQVGASGALPALAATVLTPNSASNETQPAALGIEDLQVALWIDSTGGNRVIDPDVPGLAYADEWVHNASGETLDTALSPDPVCDLRRVEAVRISIVARATSQDRGAEGRRPLLENHVAGPDDGFHRVVLTTVVALRN